MKSRGIFRVPRKQASLLPTVDCKRPAKEVYLRGNPFPGYRPRSTIFFNTPSVAFQ